MFAEYNNDYYDHPGVVVTASSGDCGYLNEACLGEPGTANFPADSPDVRRGRGDGARPKRGNVEQHRVGRRRQRLQRDLRAPLWQSDVADFSATGCGEERSIADVAAIGDPETGVDVYDSTPEGNGDPTGWGVWGGTSVASPIIAAEFALAGGSHGVAYPAATLYSHAGEGDDLYDVVSGSNGTCAGAHRLPSEPSASTGPLGSAARWGWTRSRFPAARRAAPCQASPASPKVARR